LTLGLIASVGAWLPARSAVDVLTAVGGLPPNIVGQLRDPAAFVETPDGRFLVLDRRAQVVFVIDAAKTTLKRLVNIGPSDGEILRPLAFVSGPERTFSILDNPGNYERVQTFHDTGTPLSVFRRFPSSDDALRVNVDAMLSSGFGAIAAIGRELLTQIPDGAALMSQLNAEGHITRRIGVLRPTGHERDPELHRALNTGIPLVAPDGSLYFVFTAGVPMIRKYSSSGTLIYERHVEGPELDPTLQALPTEWPRRKIEGREFPNVTSTVATAAIDHSGRLWISLAVVPVTYVYDTDGSRMRTVQFRGAGVILARSFFFTRNQHVLVTPGCYEFDAR